MVLKESPGYVDDRRIQMTAYMGPRRRGWRFWNQQYGKNPKDPAEGYPGFITDEVFEDYKNAGLSFLMPEGDAFFEQDITERGSVYQPDFCSSDLYTYMKMAEKHKLDVYPAVECVFGSMTHEEGPFGKTEKEILRHFVETVQTFCPERFKGIMLTDEPGIRSIGRVKKIVRYLRSEEIRAIKPDLEIFSAMLPSYAALECYQEGYIYPDHKKQIRFDRERAEIYGGYMDACADALGEFSFDYYALQRGGRLSPGFYQNLELAAERGRKGGYPISVTLQSFMMLWRYNPKTSGGTVIYRTPTYEDIRWQVYSALAFGVRRIGWFTFWQHYSEGDNEAFPNAMVVYDPAEEQGYRRTEIYHAVAAVNREIVAFDHVFLRFQWQGCQVVRKSREQNIRLVKGGYSLSCLKKITGSRDTLVGCMKNPEDDREGFWIVNAHNPARYEQNDITAVFEGATHVWCYRLGKEHTIPLEAVTVGDISCGCLSVRLSVGEGIFVIPFRSFEGK